MGFMMAVHPKKRGQAGVGRLQYAVNAADILKEDHPLHRAFTKWLGDKTASKRQAREFLQAYPQYREVQNGPVGS